MTLTKDRIEQLMRDGLDLVRRAEDVPLGSLAHAIAKRIDCTITLWPYKDLASTQERAIVYDMEDSRDHVEFVILHAPSDDGKPGSMNLLTRFVVAHELAHIALRHPMQNRNRNPKIELEANFLALLLLAVHGAPVERAKLLSHDADSVLDRALIARQDKVCLLEAVEHVLVREQNRGSDNTWIWPIPSDVLKDSAIDANKQSCRELRNVGEQELRRFKLEHEYRSKAIEVATSALAVALGEIGDL